jgi:hypothetical protein
MTESQSKASKPRRPLTRQDVFENIDELVQEIIGNVLEIAEHQRHQVEYGRDVELGVRIQELADNASVTIRMLSSPVRYRGAE